MPITLMIATLSVEPGWAVGTVSSPDPAIDRDILLDASGRPWIPGSSIAGSLRAHLAATPPAEPPADERLMGSPPPASRDESADIKVSPLWVLGAVFSPGAGSPGDGLETVGQTAVDRTRGAAAAGSLRFSRLAAAGGTLTVYLRHDADEEPLSMADLQLIAGWHPAIGRDRTRGSGRARLLELRHGTVDPATPAGAATWLSHQGLDLFAVVATQRMTGPAEEGPWLEASFGIIDGLLIGSSLAERAASTRKREGRPLIPGSAWKGIIRSRTEYIIRSRYGENAACQQRADSCVCVACAVFGHQGRRGTLAFRDSYIQPAADDPAADGPAADGGAPAAADPEPVRTHVGIDRVTGGSRDALLFQTAPLTSGRLQLRIDALGPVEPWVRNTIRHVLRDIGDGLIGVGSRSTRGLGTLRLADPPGELEPVVIPQLEEPATLEPVIIPQLQEPATLEPAVIPQLQEPATLEQAP